MVDITCLESAPYTSHGVKNARFILMDMTKRRTNEECPAMIYDAEDIGMKALESDSPETDYALMSPLEKCWLIADCCKWDFFIIKYNHMIEKVIDQKTVNGHMHDLRHADSRTHDILYLLATLATAEDWECGH